MQLNINVNIYIDFIRNEEIIITDSNFGKFVSFRNFYIL